MDAGPRRILGVLAGEDVPIERLAAWARSAEVVLAADGAADRLLEAGVVPDVVIGDMDSIGAARESLRMELDPDQATSDADKLLSFAQAEGYVEVTLVGVEGDRLDHVLASLASAARSLLRVRFILRSGLGWVLASGREARIAASPGDLVSLIPLETCAGVRFAGVRWPLEDAVLSATGLVSLSNRAAANEVVAQIACGAALLVHVSSAILEPTW